MYEDKRSAAQKRKDARESIENDRIAREAFGKSMGKREAKRARRDTKR